MKKVRIVLFFGLVIALLTVAVLGAPQGQIELDDVATPVLIDTLPVLERVWHKASVSLGDYNDDGWVDVFVTTNERGYVYKNHEGAFEHVSDEVLGVSFEHVHMGLWGDVNNNGCLDLFVTRQSQFHYGLYINNCDGTFTDASGRIDPPISVNGYGASFIDINDDALLDVFAVSFDRDNHRNFNSYSFAVDYSDVGGVFDPVVYQEDNTLLVQEKGRFILNEAPYRSVLAGGLFGSSACARAHGISRDSGGKLGPKYGFKQAYQPVWFDADGDGLIDVFVSYDYGFSALYRQATPGAFEDVTERAGLCKLGNAMGISIGDIDNDQDFDIYVTNIGANYLFVNDGTGSFEERGAEAGVIDYSNSGWGISFADFNNDTLLDFIVSNGREVAPLWPYDEMDKLFLNRDGSTFTELGIEHRSLLKYEPSERNMYNADAATATGDLNNDGSPDAVIFRPHTGALYALLGKPNGNHWLEVSLEGRESNRGGVGARIEVEARGASQVRTVTAGTSYLAQDDIRQHFGLGKHTMVDVLHISWPSGAVDEYYDVAADQHLKLKEGEGQ